MDGFGSIQLLFILAGGYLPLQYCHLSKHRWDALEWERNLFEATLVGASLFAITRLLIVLAEALLPTGSLRSAYHAVIPVGYAGSLTLAPVLGLVAAAFVNRRITRESALELAVRRYGGDLLTLLLEAANERTPVLLTMNSRKVYVGFVVAWPSLGARHAYVKLLPTLSGYRDEATHRIEFTTSYWHVYADRAPRATGPPNDRLFGVVVPVSEIASARLFDESIYERYFSPRAGGVPPAGAAPQRA
jgi:hypothetical protein